MAKKNEGPIPKVKWLSPPLPDGRTVPEVVVSCPVGMGSCIIMKVSATKAYEQLGLPAHISPSVQWVPVTDVGGEPDVVMCFGNIYDEVVLRTPDRTIVMEVDDYYNVDNMKRKIVETYLKAGWIEIVK